MFFWIALVLTSMGVGAFNALVAVKLLIDSRPESRFLRMFRKTSVYDAYRRQIR